MTLPLKRRSFSVTVHLAHLDRCIQLARDSNREGDPTFSDYLGEVGKLKDKGVIDYAVVSLEESSQGLVHLQGFVVWNESAFDEDKKPTEWLPGHWTRARSLSGARDYCAAVGIHIKKQGLFGVIEYGDWVDPGWNQSLRSRLIYQLAAELEHGTKYSDLCAKMPAAVLLVGPSNLSNVQEMRAFAQDGKARSLATEPYYYIGLTFLFRDFLKSRKTLDFLSKAEEQSFEEE